MKVTYSVSVLIVLIFCACSNSKNSATSTDSATVSASSTSAAFVNKAFNGTKWQLIELAGAPVADSVNGKMPFISFNLADSSYTASGGCNGLGGKFTVDTATLRITFKQGMSTMMACPDMTVETGFSKLFDNVDNYTLNDSILSLNKARMAPLARFRAVK